MSDFEKANQHYNNQEYETAISMYKKCIENDTAKTSSMYNMAICYIKLKQYSIAKEYLMTLLNVVDNYKVMFNIAVCYSKLGYHKKAYIYLKSASAAKCDDVDIINGINKLEKIIFKEEK